MSGARSIPYRPEIDGLRALAVVAVILFHLSPGLLPAGFVGVDIFFVISGYLITSIILADNATAGFTLSRFWGRRVRRILPALGFMLVAVLLATLALGLPSLVNSGGKQAVATTACVSNYRMLTLTSDYWSTQSDRILLLHTWSLAVEEQFYLLFPLLVAAMFAWARPSMAPRVLLTLLLLSLGWCAALSARATGEAFFLMPPRAWELSVGALLAFHETRIRDVPDGLAKTLAFFGGILLLVALVAAEPASFPWPFALFPVAGAALFIAFGARAPWMRSLFGHPAIVFVGKASYSLYLWHWPCLVIGGLVASALEAPWIRSVSLFAGLVLGWLSFRLIEPLGRREGFTLRLAPLLATAMAALAFYCTYRKPSVAPGDFVSSGWKGGAYDARFQPGFSGARLGADLPGLRADIALLGDSHALSLASELDAMMRQRALAGAVFASGGTRVINWRQTRYDLEPVARDRFERNRDEFLSRRQPRWVVLVARWETLDDPDALDAVDRLLSHVFSLSPDSQIVIVGQPPHFPYGDIKMHEWLNWRRRLGVEEPSLAMPPNPALHRVGAALSALAESRPGVHYLPVDDLFPSHDGRISPLEHGVLLYEDDDHLSDAGARKIVGILWPLLGPTLR